MKIIFQNRRILSALAILLLGVGAGWYWRGGHEMPEQPADAPPTGNGQAGKRERAKPAAAETPEVTETIRGGVRVVRRGNRTQAFRIDGPKPEFDLGEFREGFRGLASKYSGSALVKAQIDEADYPEELRNYLEGGNAGGP